MYSTNHYYNPSQYNTNAMPTHSRSSYNLQQYASSQSRYPNTVSNNNNVTPSNNISSQPQQFGTQRSLSHSNLQSYYSNQQQQLQHHTRIASNNTMQSISNPCVNNGISAGGIVLQSLSCSNNIQSTNNNIQSTKVLCDTNMNANLAQFAKYSQLQLQQVLSQYPAWLQKEYMRRLQRQYEELYVVEDPKIHHWSNICPREKEANNNNKVTDENVCPNIISIVAMDHDAEEDENDHHSSCEYLSESATLSPSPIYHQNDIEGTTSPINKPMGDDNKMLTCFAILDYIKPAEKEKQKCDDKFEIIEECSDECDIEESECDESEIEEVHDNADNVQSPKEDEQYNIQEQVSNGYYQNVNVQQQQQQYQQAYQYYQQKVQAQAYQRSRQLLLQQQQQQQAAMQHQQHAAMQHQTYLMQQNKYVAQYVRQQTNTYPPTQPTNTYPPTQTTNTQNVYYTQPQQNNYNNIKGYCA